MSDEIQASYMIIDGDEMQVSHIDIWYDFNVKDWCSDVIDINGHYIDNTAEWSATRAYAIWRSKMNTGVPIHVYVKGKSDPKVDSYKLIENN
jgi:hypothetical protein|tara:strand:- start:101 stop:376 length:276 start_codon:yes stop_codon:yes gene_type:complete